MTGYDLAADVVTLTVPRALARQILHAYNGPRGTPLDTLLEELARVMLMAGFDEESQPGGMVALVAPNLAEHLRAHFDEEHR